MKTLLIFAIALLTSALNAVDLIHDKLPGTEWACSVDNKPLGTVTFKDAAIVELSWQAPATWQAIPGGVEIFGVALAYGDKAFTGINGGGKPVSLTLVTATPAAAPPAAVKQAAPERFIPGLAAVDVHGNLTNKGFALEKIQADGKESWICKLQDSTGILTGDAYGQSATKILSVQGTAVSFNPSNINSVAGEFLGFLASLPYEGSSPAQARAWVVANIHHDSVTRIGGVKFEIFAKAPASRMLRMSMEP